MTSGIPNKPYSPSVGAPAPALPETATPSGSSSSQQAKTKQVASASIPDISRPQKINDRVLQANREYDELKISSDRPPIVRFSDEVNVKLFSSDVNLSMTIHQFQNTEELNTIHNDLKKLIDAKEKWTNLDVIKKKLKPFKSIFKTSRPETFKNPQEQAVYYEMVKIHSRFNEIYTLVKALNRLQITGSDDVKGSIIDYLEIAFPYNAKYEEENYSLVVRGPFCLDPNWHSFANYYNQLVYNLASVQYDIEYLKTICDKVFPTTFLTEKELLENLKKIEKRMEFSNFHDLLLSQFKGQPTEFAYRMIVFANYFTYTRTDASLSEEEVTALKAIDAFREQCEVFQMGIRNLNTNLFPSIFVTINKYGITYLDERTKGAITPSNSLPINEPSSSKVRVHNEYVGLLKTNEKALLEMLTSQLS